MKGQERASKKLNKALAEVQAKGAENTPHIKGIQDEMNEMLRRVQADSRDKEAKMQEKLRQVIITDQDIHYLLYCILSHEF